MRVHTTLFTGCTIFEPRGIDARITAYRWHIADPVIFKKSLKFEIERRGFAMNSKGVVIDSFKPRPDYWSSVAYWYQDRIAEPWCPFPPYKERVNPEIVLHLPQVVKTMRHSAGVELQVLPYNRATWTKPWFRVQNETIGSWIEIPFEIKEKGRYSMSLFQTLREDQGIWKVLIDGKELTDAGESQIAGGYTIDEVTQLPPEKINTVLDFYNVYKKNEHEDYIWGQGRERKIGLFEFAPGTHALKLVCIGANPLAVDPETGKPGYNLAADILSLRKLPFENMDAWLEKMIELGKEEVAGGGEAGLSGRASGLFRQSLSLSWPKCRDAGPPLAQADGFDAAGEAGRSGGSCRRIRAAACTCPARARNRAGETPGRRARRHRSRSAGRASRR